MSFKAKDLTYDRNEPTFLKRLRSQYGDGSAVRHERPIPRPRKPRDPDEDEPAYVLEESNETISKEQYEALLIGTAAPAHEEAEKTTEDNRRGEEKGADKGEGNEQTKDYANSAQSGRDDKNQGPSLKENVARVGSSKKRRQGKAVRDDSPEVAESADKSAGTPRKQKRKQKQKKRVKLSFEDEEEEQE